MSPGQYRFASFVLDVGQGLLRRDGAEIALRPKPLALLAYLVANAGRVVGKDELLDALWPRVVVTEDSLTRCISEVRTALGEGAPSAIRTLSRRGYLFTLPVANLNVEPAAGRRERDLTTASQREPVGRADDLARLRGLLDARRTITLVGPGGVGKSCLARWLLQERESLFAHGAGWVDLSAIADADLLPSAIGTALGLPTAAGAPLAALLAALQPLSLLIVLDNVERLAAAVAPVVQAIHDAAAHVSVLVTSQVPLQIDAEIAYRLEPLDVPDADAARAAAMQSGALQLFIHRATAADARFALDDHGIDRAAGICRRLGGLPLSIELVASRAPTLGLSALEAMLDERLLVLSNRRRDAPVRQQSLQAALEWSYGLLDEECRRVLRHLSVFSGSFELAAAEAVADSGPPTADHMVDCVDVLVDHSLLASERGPVVRYRLLETTRAFATARLAEAGERDAAEARHAAYFRRRLEDAYETFFRGPRSAWQWRNNALADLDDGRAALSWAATHGDGVTALSLATSLAFVVSSEQPLQRRRFLEAAAPFVDEAMPPLLRARHAIETAYDLAASRPALALQHALPAVDALRSAGDMTGLYRALGIVIYCDPIVANPAQHAAFAELRAIEQHDWPPVLLASGAHAAACWYSARGEFESAIERRRAAYALYTQADHPWQALVAQANMLDSLLAAGRLDAAIACGEALEAQLQRTRRLAALPAARLNLAGALLARDDTASARPIAREGWAQARQLGWQAYWADYLSLLAALDGCFDSAGRVLGYADARYADEGTAREINEQRAADRVAALLDAELGAPAAQRLRSEGRSVSDAEVERMAFGESVH